MTAKKFSYNEAMLEVERILASLEKDNPDIDEMSLNVKRAVELLQACKQKLYETDEEIKKVFEDLKVQ
jgi:exodeoxyribonuclease VII small subunit